METIRFLDKDGIFYIEQPENYNNLYFPSASEKGIKSSLSPNLGGDIKINQNAFLLEPVSIENLHNNRSTRNFWCIDETLGAWSVTGVSAEEEYKKFTDLQDKSSMEAGFMWQAVTRKSGKYQMEAKVTSFVPFNKNIEIMHIEITNTSMTAKKVTHVAAIPVFGRSADNIRDHRHVTSLLHRIKTTDYGVYVKPTLSFDERGHQKNNLTYFVLQFIILFTAGYYVIHGKIAYSIFMMLETYIWRIDEVVESISDFGVNYNKVTVSLKRIGEIINNELYEDEKFGNVELKDVKGIIELKDVKFKYSDEEDNTLKGLSLKFEPRQKIAVVGRSGNGKSTIFNLLLRYFDATEGVITVDGVDIKDLTEDSLRRNISIIRQAPFLFNLSILDNFKLAKEDVSLEEVRKFCREAYIDDYIMSLPNKYDTIIGEGGINLSGGQKQRLAIARTLLLDTKIILFDEATSALDNESQEYIKKTIDNLVKNHTVIIVAHRLSTIVDADIINVIDKGQLAGSGSHEELLKSSKVYQGLYQNESSNSEDNN